MSSTQFVEMYHPALGNRQATVPRQAVDDYEATGWLLVDPNATPAEPSTPYITLAALLSQIAAGAAPIGTALRAAFDGWLGDTLVVGTTAPADPSALWLDTRRVFDLATYPLFIYDDFARTPSALSLGVASSGEAWIPRQGVWGVDAGGAYLATPSLTTGSNSNDTAGFDAGTPDVTIDIKIGVVDANLGPGVAFRGTGPDNCFTTRTTALFTRIAGVNTNIATFSQTLVAGDTLRVTLKGDLITVYRDAGSTGAFVQIAQVTSTFNNTATFHGIRTRTTSEGRISRFIMRAA